MRKIFQNSPWKVWKDDKLKIIFIKS
jgi:hypothetical protein